MTEDVSERYSDFDKWSPEDAVAAMYEGQLEALAVLWSALADISTAVTKAAATLGEQGRLVYVGAGTSGRLAVQDGAELKPTFNWPQARTVFCIAGGLEALTVSIEGAEDSVEDGTAIIQDNNVNENDVVIAVAASGRTPYTLAALREAKRRGALTIGIVNNAATPILLEAEVGILADTGSELVAGSTRMKAGTVQKVILNMISTAVMAQMGRVYRGYMVDMVVSNQKLANRAVGMVSDIAECSPEVARAALDQANNHIKTAILICSGVPAEKCKLILAEHGGNLRSVLETQQGQTSES